MDITYGLLINIVCMWFIAVINGQLFNHKNQKIFGAFNYEDECLRINKFKCIDNGTCIDVAKVCDKLIDCGDGSDEADCDNRSRLTIIECNQTIQNSFPNRFLIKTPLFDDEKIYCFYKIQNFDMNNLIHVKFVKFNVGFYHVYTSTCDQAWIEIYDTQDNTHLNQTKLGLRSSKIILNKKKVSKKLPGRLCGNSYNTQQNYYSDKNTVLIKFHQTESLAFNEFELEIKFPPKITTTKDELKINKNFSRGIQIDDTKCNKLFKNCHLNMNNSNYACVLQSPGHPGVYLRNLRCLYYIRKTDKVPEKLIILNENLQLSTNPCQSNQSNCDYDAIRSGKHVCHDYINFYTGLSTSNTETAPILNYLCGHGKLSKIVTNKHSLVVEFLTSPDSSYFNFGFKFYILSIKQYFDNYEMFSSNLKNIFLNSNIIDLNEFKSIQKIERLQIENCDSTTNDCVIDLDNCEMSNDTSTFLISERENCGYLFGPYQYHMRNFTLKYNLKTTDFNTIGILIENLNVSRDCATEFLQIEYKKFNFMKQCIKSHQKFHLIQLSPDESKQPQTTTVSYFSLKEKIYEEDIYNKFKIFYEFFDFPWMIYVKDTLCDFVIRADTGQEQKGYITNLNAHFFFKQQIPNKSLLKCSHKIYANKNQYIKLTINQIDFMQYNCENYYFELTKHFYKYEKICNEMSQKLILKESNEHAVDSTATTNTLMRACLCRRDIKKYFISRYNYIEILYEVRVDQLNTRISNKFNLTYEILNRKCENVGVKDTKTKGQIIHAKSSKNGIQDGFDNLDNWYYNIRESLIISEDNKNYYCNFELNAPDGYFIYIELLRYNLSAECRTNFIKIHPILTNTRTITPTSTFIKLCSPTNDDLVDYTDNQTLNLDLVAEFSDDLQPNYTLSCYNLKHSICFMTHDVDKNFLAQKRFIKKINIEILAFDLNEFYFEINYFYYKIFDNNNNNLNLEYLKSNENRKSSSSSSNSDNCKFECSPVRDSLHNETVRVCLDESLRCDNEANCIYSDDDESNCPSKFYSITIISILIGIFTLSVLALFLYGFIKILCKCHRKRQRYRKAKQRDDELNDE